MKSKFSNYFILFKNFFNIGIVQTSSMLLQFLTVPVIIRQYGLTIFGEIALSTSVAYLFGNIINYGTNQTTVKHIAVSKSSNLKLAELFSQTLQLRCFVFVGSLLVLYTISKFTILDIIIWISILPILLAEIFNPLFFLLGIEKVQWLSWNVLVARILSFLLIIFVFKEQHTAFFLNLFVGIPLILVYLSLLIFIIFNYKIRFRVVSIKVLINQLVNNFYVTFNGSVGILQQSIFLFFVAGTFNSTILGAYGLVDKMLNAFRQLVSSFSSAIYPRAAVLFNTGRVSWVAFRTTIQIVYSLCSVLTGIILFFFPDHLVRLISDDVNVYAVEFTRLLSFAFIFLSLNANNILDLLLAEKYKLMFYISIAILFCTLLISFILSRNYFQLSIGWYPLLIEATCFLIYSFVIRKLKLHGA
jgi:O-antigen/teichoic acid export membrane protein